MPYRSLLKKYLLSLKKFLPLRIAAYVILLSFSYTILPLYLRKFFGYYHLWPLAVFYAVNTLLVLYLFKKDSDKKYGMEYRVQQVQEELNVLSNQNSQELKNQVALQEKIIRYNSLKEVVEEINENLDLDSVTQNITSVAFSMIPNDRGSCLLFIVDKQTQRLNLFKTKKEDKKLVIKAKEGDIFDFWVLRHASPLLIEDIKKDFRFDLEKLSSQDRRVISSLVSAPFLSDHNFLGILRLDHPDPAFYSQNDLRFLVTICDLGAVALENSELFQKAQDLAIHDSLTSLYTKGFFLESLKEECKVATRQSSLLSLLMLDIDYFKNYNDKFGHTAGDLVLKVLSNTIQKFLRDFDCVISRFGGEEFCVILRGVEKKSAFAIAEKLRETIEKEKIVLRRQETRISVSIGLASFPADATERDSLILKADRAMYEAKQKGRNRVCSI